MSLDLLIPFAILIILVVYLIYTRQKFEKEIVTTYEKKFDEWKEHAQPQAPAPSKRELVGLVFKKDGKIDIEVFDERAQIKLQQGKFHTKVK